MTNGEKFKEIFGVSQVDEGVLYAFAWLPNHNAAEFCIDWWNAEYEEPITKNDLGVDCIVDVLGSYTDLDIPYKREIAENILTKLPSVTPKGHWTEEFNDLEGEVRFTCSSCGKYQLFGTDFCYHCGSDNREVDK